MEQLATGVTTGEIARKYEVRRKSIVSSRNNIDRLIPVLSGEPFDMDDPEFRTFRIYEQFTMLMDYFDEQKENKTELSRLLNSIPEIEEIFRYLATGKSYYSYIKLHNLPGKKEGCEKVSNEVCAMLLQTRERTRTFEIPARNKVFMRFLQSQTNAYGVDILSIVHQSCLTFIKDERIPRDRNESVFVWSAKHFFELAMLTDYFTEKQKISSDLSRFKIMGLENINNPYQINTEKYLWYYYTKGEIPKGVQILLSLIMDPESKPSFYKFLKQNDVCYAEKTLIGILNSGSRLIENLLLKKTVNYDFSHPLNLKYLMTSRHAQAKRIMEIVGEEIRRRDRI